MGKSKKESKFCIHKNRTSSLKIKSGFIQKRCPVPFHYKTRSRGAKIEDLPVEIIIKIFSYLSLEDLYKNVRFVNYNWWCTASSPCLWTIIKAGPDISTNMLSNWLDMAPRLKTLVIDFRVDAGVILSKIPKCNKEIEVLKVHNCWGSEKNQNLPSLPLCQILIRCPHLASISLRGSKFISCKFFQLLFTRDDIIAKKRLRKQRKNVPLEFFGDFTPKQLRAFLLARRDTRVRKTASLSLENQDPEIGLQLQPFNELPENDNDIDRIINSIFFQ